MIPSLSSQIILILLTKGINSEIAETDIKNVSLLIDSRIFLKNKTHNTGIQAKIEGVLLAKNKPQRKKHKHISLLIKIQHEVLCLKMD